MVRHTENRITKPAKKLVWLLIIVLILSGSIMIYFSSVKKEKTNSQKVEITKKVVALSNTDKSMSNISELPTKNTPKVIEVEERFNNKEIEVPIDFRWAFKVDSENFIYYDTEKQKDIIEYNIKTKKRKSIMNVHNKKNYIKTLAVSDNWAVWVECDKNLLDTSNKPFEWEMVAQNRATNKQIVVDKSSFKTNKYDVPMFINYMPMNVYISKNGTIVYCNTKPNENKVSSEIVAYDLNSNKRRVIDNTPDVNNEYIINCHICEDIIAWSKFRKLQTSYETRLTQYLYSDLFVHDLNSDKTEQITSNDFYDEPFIYENLLVATRVPQKRQEQNACNSEIVLIDLKSKKIDTIVDEKSQCYKTREYELYRTQPKINDKYISWLNNGFPNGHIYDYTKRKFVNLFDTKKNPDKISYIIWNLFDDGVIMTVSNGSEVGTCKYISTEEK